MSKAKSIAQDIHDKATSLGWTYLVRGNVLTIRKDIDSDNESFVKADMEYYDILSLAPQTEPGSMWGTDGGGIGALSALKSNVFVMNKSGISKRVLSALKKLNN